MWKIKVIAHRKLIRNNYSELKLINLRLISVISAVLYIKIKKKIKLHFYERV